MSTDRDVTRIVRSWMDEGVTALPDRVLDAVLDQLPATPQRRAGWLARRLPFMNTSVRIALVAAAAVVVAVIGFQFVAGQNVGGPGPSPSPSVAPTATPVPSPTPAAKVFPPAGELAVGARHSMTLDGVPFTFSVPTSDWLSNGSFGIDKSTGVGPDGAGFIFWVNDTPTGVFADPCADVKSPPVGPSAAELAAAVAAVPGTDLLSGPSDVTVGGHPAKHVVITIREDVDCDAMDFYLWYAPTPGEDRYATELGSTIRVWIIDIDGTLVWIDGETYKGAGPEPGQEIQQVIDSIQFE